MKRNDALLIQDETSREWSKVLTDWLRDTGFNVQPSNRKTLPQTLLSKPDFVVVLDANVLMIGEVKVVHHTFPNTPIVFATGSLTAAIAKEAVDAGATVVVSRESAVEACRNLWNVLGDTAQRRESFPLRTINEDLVEKFHSPTTGRLDARPISKAFGLSLAALAKSIGLTPSALTKRPRAMAAQEGLRELEFSWAVLVRMLGNEDLTRAWLNAGHPDLDGRPPLDLITRGSARDLANYLRSALVGETT